MKRFILLSSLATLVLAGSLTAQEKSKKEKLEEKVQKVNERKAKADSLLQKAGISTPDAGVSGSVMGKSVTPKDAVGFFTETLPDLGLKVKELRKAEKARRLKKKRFHTEYDAKPIVKMAASRGSGDRITQEEFHVLKESQIPRLYDGIDVFWYDARGRIISKSAIKDKENTLILHGPYKRYVAGNLVEEGFYHFGRRDGRWETYDAEYHLLDKTKWHQGVPADGKVSYYDSAHTKICEVIPIQLGKRKGDYLKYYDGGQLMIKGQYDNDMPVGTWTEYYQFRRQRKKVTRYPRYWYEDGEAIVLNEWDDKGKLTYERPKDQATSNESEN